MTFLGILFIGLLGTAIFDLWVRLIAKLQSAPMPAWALPGRWFGHLARGKFRHDRIADATPIPNETAIGWIGHYAIGILFAAIVVIWGGPGWLSAPTFAKPFVVGVVTVLAGWLIMSPGMGNGIAGSRTPNPPRLRALQVLAHVVFGLGMWCAALIFSAFV
ncbi:DUF2938 domain-containing protein [Pseudoruegeria sp. SK021]|uniref:DUF2938 domain-containing protein n=1 Tax=Pseudoruegeria sp. SK021 TaxID=1933035 RepID=UPI000A3209AB|nr:DUF2938 domain-containing protein [Pseudoruegeria sp. SK021]